MPCPYCASAAGLMASETEVVCEGCGKLSSTALWKRKPAPKRKTYEDSTHGAKGREQKRLKTSGATHQSEHVVGYEVFGHGAKRGGSEFAKTIENRAPAYQEDFDSHRGHIGTGSWKDYRGTGESSEQYRVAQRRMVRGKRVGNAVQLNQLYYAHQPEFRAGDPSHQSNLKKADDSFQRMVQNFAPVPLWDGSTLVKVGVTAIEKAEMNLARMTARGGSYPTRKEELEQMKKFRILPSQDEQPKKGPVLPFSSDRNGIPMDGNCLFHSIWAGLHSIMPDAVGFVTNDMLRKQAVGFLRCDPEINDLGILTHAYLDAMGQDSTWGGELEAMALAHVWGVRITVRAKNYTITYNQAAHAGFDIYYGDSHYSSAPF
jgi:hypothetical protein